jgi:hypothetical protein
MLIKIRSIGFLICFSCVIFCSAQMPVIMSSTKPGWHLMGEAKIDFEIGRKKIEVIGADRFSSLKIILISGAISLDTIEVFYEDGSKQRFSPDKIMKTQKEKYTVSLGNKNQSLKSIDIISKTLQGKEKAQIEIWAFKPVKNKK